MADSVGNNEQVTKKSLFFWAFHGSWKLQLVLLVVIAIMVVTRVIPLEMQKRIINEAIVLKKFDQLLLYCSFYLLAVTITGLSKLCVNFLQAQIGEQAMFDMRKALYAHIVSLPLHFFRNTQPGVVVSSLMTELATAGTFAGMALAVPLANVLTLVAFAVYLLQLHTKLALITLSIYPAVVFLIPYLQKKANRLNKKRLEQSRLVASQITESITGIHEVNVHNAFTEERRKFNAIVERLRAIRLRWSLIRFGIKTVNNYFVSLGPFIIFIFGGYLVMNGMLEIGSMVAFLSAQEKLYDPWKELIAYYQAYQDASVRYDRTMRSFDIPGVQATATGVEKGEITGGGLLVTDASYTTPEGKTLLQQVNFSLQPGRHLALVGFSGSGKSTLIQCIGRMFDYTDGSIKLDGRELKVIDKYELNRRMGYISQNPFIFSGTVQDNLLYSLRASQDTGVEGEEEHDVELPSLDQLILSLQQAGFFVDVIRFGLETDYAQSTEEVTSKIIPIRRNFKLNFGDLLEEYIEFYDKERYQRYASVLENITFSAAPDPSAAVDMLLNDHLFIENLAACNLKDPLMDLGLQVARVSIEYSTVQDREERKSLPKKITAEVLRKYASIVNRVDAVQGYEPTPDEQFVLLKTSLMYAPGLHPLFTMSAELEERIVRCREEWKGSETAKAAGLLSPLDEQEPIVGRSVLDNILFGKIKTDASGPNEKVNQAIIRLLIEEDCLERVAEAGMQYHVGNMGDKLSGGQKQKLAISRVLLKEPQLILMDEATSALDNKSQARIQRLIDERWKDKRTVVSVVHRLDTIRQYDEVGVMKAGRLLEYGSYEELMEKKGLLHELVRGAGGGSS